MDFWQVPLVNPKDLRVSRIVKSPVSLPVIPCKASDFEDDLKGLYGFVWK